MYPFRNLGSQKSCIYLFLFHILPIHSNLKILIIGNTCDQIALLLCPDCSCQSVSSFRKPDTLQGIFTEFFFPQLFQISCKNLDIFYNIAAFSKNKNRLVFLLFCGYCIRKILILICVFITLLPKAGWSVLPDGYTYLFGDFDFLHEILLPEDHLSHPFRKAVQLSLSLLRHVSHILSLFF